MRMRIDGNITNGGKLNIKDILKHIDGKKKIDFDISDYDIKYLQKNGLVPLVDNLLPATKEVKNRKLLRNIKTKILDCHILKLIEKFEENDVKYIVFKGYALSNFLYSESIDRPYADIDLIVDPNQEVKVKEVLLELEYLNPYEKDYSFTRGQIVRRKELKPHNIFIELDIHFFMIGNFILRNVICFDDLYKEKQTFQLQDRKIYTTSICHTFIHCCIHYYLHDKKKDLLKSIWLYDIKLICEKIDSDDVECIVNIINERRLALVIVEVLDVVEQVFNLKESFVFNIRSSVDKNDDYYSFKKAGPTLIYLKQIVEIDNLSGKFAFISDTVIPDYKLLSLKYGGFDKRLYPIFILVRFFDITYDYGGRIFQKIWNAKSF